MIKIDKIRLYSGMAFVLIVMGCGQAGSSNHQKEFEGVITYRMSYGGKDESGIYGDTMKLYYSNGNIARVYNSDGPDALRKEVYLCRTHRYLAKKALSDTVYTFDLQQTGGLKAMRTKMSPDDTKIMGHDCQTMEIRAMHADPVYYFFSSISYSKDYLKVDKDHFSGWKFGSFDEYMGEAGVIYLKYTMTLQLNDNRVLSSKSCTAVAVKEEKVDPAVFQMDTSHTKPLTF